MAKLAKRAIVALSVTGVLVGAALVGTLFVGRVTKPKSEESETPLSLNPVSVAQADSLANPIKPATTLVHYVSIEQAQLPEHERQALTRQIHNLQTTGSSTAGELGQEFKQTTHAKMTYRFGRQQDLSFTAVRRQVVQDKLPQGFIWTGRQYEGERGEQGFDSIYRLFENPNNKARFEISETKIWADKPLTLIQELFNDNVGGVPVRFETLSDKKGVVYHHGEFVAGEQYISINSKNMTADEVKVVIGAIIAELNKPV